MKKEQVGATPTTPTGPTPLVFLRGEFGTYSERERAAIQWVEALPREEGDNLLRQAISDWSQIMNGSAT